VWGPNFFWITSVRAEEISRPRTVGMMTMATMIQRVCPKETQKVESPMSRRQLRRPTHLVGPTPLQRVKLR